MIRLCFACAICFPLGVFAQVELSLSHSQCYPGDVIQLKAVSSFEEFATFELKLPQHDALHLVANQTQVVGYNDGIYSQEEVWVLQPKHSGMIQLKEVKAILSMAGSSIKLNLPRQEITVLPYAETADRPEPQALPETLPGKVQKSRLLWVLLFSALFLVFVLLFVRARGRKPLEDLPDGDLTRDDLRAMMARGEVPTRLIERLLTDDSQSIPAETRIAMERAVYRHDISELKTQLEKGLRP